MSYKYRHYPALYVFLAMISGSALWWPLRLVWPVMAGNHLIAGTITGIILLAILFRKYFVGWILFLIAVLSFLRTDLSLTHFQGNHLANMAYDLPEVRLSGWIREVHYRRDGRHRYTLEVGSLQKDSLSQKIGGRILISTGGEFSRPLYYGQNVEIQGDLQRPDGQRNPGGFNYRHYLQVKGVTHQLRLAKPDQLAVLAGTGGYWYERAVIAPLRLHLLKRIDLYLAEPAAGLVKALLLGERQDLDSELVSRFQYLGVVHVLAISGLHVGFILLILVSTLTLLRLSYRQVATGAVLGLFFYLILVDFKAPVMRASLMAALYFGGTLLERKPRSLNVIGAAGVIILLLQPSAVYDVGFQFSFASVAAILLFYSGFNRDFPAFGEQSPVERQLNLWIRQPMLVSLAALIGTTPLTWYYYGSIQAGALLSNVLIIPLVALGVEISIFFLVSALLMAPWTAGLASLTWFIFRFLDGLVLFLSKIPYMTLMTGHPAPLTMIIFITALIFLAEPGRRRIGLFLLLLVGLSGFMPGEEKLRVTFADVGQGDGAIIESPGQRVMVIDGGENRPGHDNGKMVMAPLLWYNGIHRIHYLVGSHLHNDHIGGFDYLMEHFRVDTLVLPDYETEQGWREKLIARANLKNIPVRLISRGDQLYLDKNLRIYACHPFERFEKFVNGSGEEVNNSSLVLKIQYGENSFLFCGDAEMDAESAQAGFGDFLDIDVLKVGHHGSKTSSTQHWLQQCSPSWAVISVGEFNKFFHPSRQVIRRYREQGANVLRTDYYGAQVFESDGHELRLIDWRR